MKQDGERLLWFVVVFAAVSTVWATLDPYSIYHTNINFYTWDLSKFKYNSNTANPWGDYVWAIQKLWDALLAVPNTIATIASVFGLPTIIIGAIVALATFVVARYIIYIISGR